MTDTKFTFDDIIAETNAFRKFYFPNRLNELEERQLKCEILLRNKLNQPFIYSKQVSE